MFINMYIIFIFSLIQVAVLGVTVEQDQLSWVKTEGKSVYINCKVTDRTTDYIHWYQQKDGEAMTRILYIKHDGTELTNPQAKDFTVSVNRNSYSLKIDTLQKSHSAVYYCASWERGSDDKVFGSGTRLIVTEAGKSAEKPKLSAYPVFRPDNGRSVLLCQARGMYPDLVKFIWKDKNGNEVQLSDTEELLEQREEGQEVRVTSMLILEKEKEESNTFSCSVLHDSSIESNKDNEQKIPKEQESKPKPDSDNVPVADPTCKPRTEEKENNTKTDFGRFELLRKLNLLNLTYVSLLVKNVLYFFAVCFLLYKRRERSSKPDAEPNQEK